MVFGGETEQALSYTATRQCLQPTHQSKREVVSAAVPLESSNGSNHEPAHSEWNLDSAYLHKLRATVQSSQVCLYGASEAYESSVRCSVEARWAASQIDCIPLMIQRRYQPESKLSWLGLLIGRRVWYAFWPSRELADEDRFQQRVDALANELSHRGKRKTGTHGQRKDRTNQRCHPLRQHPNPGCHASAQPVPQRCSPRSKAACSTTLQRPGKAD